MCRLFLAIVLSFLLVWSPVAWAAPVVVSGEEVWDGRTNPHAGDGVTLATIDGVAVYTIPDGMTIAAGAEIFTWDVFGDLRPTGSLRFEFPPGSGGLHFQSAGFFETDFMDYTGSGIDTYCGNRSCGGGRTLTFNMNDNDITNGEPAAGAIYNFTSQLEGRTGSSPTIQIFSDADVTIGHILPATYDAGGGAVNIQVGGHFDVFDVKTDDPTGGGGSGDSINISAGSITLRGLVDTSALRPDASANNGPIVMQALAPPDFALGNQADNTAAQNVFTMASGSQILTDAPNLFNAGGDVTISAVKGVFESGSSIIVSENATLLLQFGVTGGGFTEADLFMDNSGQGLTPVLEIFHDGLGPAFVEYVGGRDWTDENNWSPQAAPVTNSSVALFGGNVTSPRTVFIDTDVSTKSIRFDTPNKVAVAGVATLNLEADTGPSSVEVLQGDHEFQVRVALQNDTTADVAAGTSVEFNNRLTLNGNTLTKTGDGTLDINNRLNSGGGSIVVNGGTVGGGGSIGGDLNNSSGTVAPGNSAGVLTVQSNYTQGSSATLAIEIGGFARGEEYDVLNVLGTATLDGELEVMLVNGFDPDSGEFDILDFASVAGDFATFTLPTDFQWDVATGTLSVGGVQLDGDFDKDGDVDGDDFLAWQANFGTASGATQADGDADGDGDVDGDDFLTWQANFGSVAGAAAAAAVPEPSTFILALFAVLLLVRRQRHLA